MGAAGNAAGTGSQWATDLEINNPSINTVSYKFLWLPRGTDNSAPTESAVYTLAPGASASYENIVGEVFGVSAFGALAVASDAATDIVMSRTYNVSATGTFGQSIDGILADFLIPANQTERVIFMDENDATRANLGLLNGTAAPIEVKVQRHDAQGNTLGEVQTVALAAYSNTQVNRVMQAYAPVTSGYVDVWTDTVGGGFLAYGSVLDNVSSDPTTVMPQ